MSKELEDRIERKKETISNFLKLAKAMNMSQEEIDKRLDMFLEDLAKLMKQRD